MTVREVLGHKYTAYLERLYSQVIRFILSLLVVGFNQTFSKSPPAHSNNYRDSVASIGSAFTRNTDTNTTNNNHKSSSSRVSNCWSDGDYTSPTSTATTKSSDAAVKLTDNYNNKT